MCKTRKNLDIESGKYMFDVFKKSNMLDCAPCKTPMVLNPRLNKKLVTPIEEHTLYRSIIGSLQYLTMTRPDIQFCVNHLSQIFLQSPTDIHL